MLDFAVDDVHKLATGLALLVPGALILYVRAQFLTGRRKAHSEEALSYVIVTLLYFTLAYPLFSALSAYTAEGAAAWFAWAAFILIVPIAIGLLVGAAVQSGWPGRLAQAMGLEMVHPVPTAWDWKFGQRDEHWLILVLKDGTKFHGYFGRGSFAASDGERDIYVQRIFSRGEDGTWQPLSQGLWVRAGEIQTIEFLPVER